MLYVFSHTVRVHEKALSSRAVVPLYLLWYNHYGFKHYIVCTESPRLIDLQHKDLL